MCHVRVSLSESDAIKIKFKPLKRYKPSSAFQGYGSLFDSSLKE